MRPLSATECISPAIDRTKHILFSPFRKGRTWKLCATSYVCLLGSMYVPAPLLYLAAVPALQKSGTAVLTIIGVLVVIGLALFTWIFYLCSRLQFAYFDMIANRGEFVAPAWRKYRNQALPWTLFKLVLGIVFTAIISVPLVAWMRQIIPMLMQMHPVRPGGQMDPQFARLLGEIYGGYGLMLLLIGSGMLLFGVLGDFIVPSLALEDTGIGEAFRRMGVLIQQEPGEFALYVLLKTVLGIAGYFAAIILWEIAFLLATLIIGIVVALIGFGLHAAGVPTIALAVPGILLAIAWYVFAVFYSMLFGIGPVLTWMDAYAIYFLGGRYPLLGDLLDRSTPPPPSPLLIPYAAYPPPLPPTA